MGINLIEIGTASMVLFAVIDIVGSIPLIIELRSKSGDLQTVKATIISMVIMIAFLFVGESILKIIGIDVNSFAIAGSFILFFMALEMILGIKLYKDDLPGTASVVPLAFPIIAGAGTITSILSLRAEYEAVNIVIAILINMVPVYLVLKLTGKIEKLIGKGGIAVVRKVFGIILLAIAVKLFRTNIGIIK